MPRAFTCTECGDQATTESTRGPLPQRCTKCKPQDARPQNQAGAYRPPPGNKITRRRHPETHARVQEAIQMRLQYHTWSQVADALNWNDGRSAMQAVRREQERRMAMVDESLDQLRDQEMHRLEALGLAALRVLENKHVIVNAGQIVTEDGTPVLLGGTPILDDGPALAAVNTLVKVSESLRKLLGLDAATKVDAAVTVQYTIHGIPESEMP